MRLVAALGFGWLAWVAGCGDALLGYGRDSGEAVESSANYDGGDATMEAGTGPDRRDAAMEAGTGPDRGNATMEVGTGPDGSDAAADATTDAGGGVTSDASDGSTDAAAVNVVLSNKCTNGIVSIASDVLNPGDVYLDGTLEKGACYEDALTHWSDPNSACTGFDCNFLGGSAVIRPTDGRMLYMNSSELVLREFHADACPMPAMSAYPSNPLANDTIIPTPMCPVAAGVPTTGVTRFVVSPEGNIYYHCVGVEAIMALWYDLAGNLVYDESNGYALQKVARGRTALVGSGSNYKLANLTTGVLTDVAAPPWTAGYIVAVRALDPAGFWVAAASGSSDPELWEIHPDGTSTKIGSYPPLPAGQSLAVAATLDGCGALLQICSGPMVSEGTIVRRQVQGSSQVIYDDATMPLVKIGFYLITGP
jgi:hypothetical protein